VRTEDYLAVERRDTPAGVTVIAVRGEVDYGSVYKLRTSLADALRLDQVRLAFDVSGMLFCDSSGVGFFIDAHTRTRERGGWARLAGMSPEVYSVFRMLNLDRLLVFYDTLDAALTDVDGGAAARTR
jgi:anti-sigma B factor antagonist